MQSFQSRIGKIVDVVVRTKKDNANRRLVGIVDNVKACKDGSFQVILNTADFMADKKPFQSFKVDAVIQDNEITAK